METLRPDAGAEAPDKPEKNAPAGHYSDDLAIQRGIIAADENDPAATEALAPEECRRAYLEGMASVGADITSADPNILRKLGRATQVTNE